jgi:hypothetical protein
MCRQLPDYIIRPYNTIAVLITVTSDSSTVFCVIDQVDGLSGCDGFRLQRYGIVSGTFRLVLQVEVCHN